MSTAALNGVGSVTKASVAKIIDLVSDDDDSENDGAPKVVSRDTSRVIPHHQNAVSQTLQEASNGVANANESSLGDELNDDEDDSDSDDDDDDEDSLLADLLDGLTDEAILDNHSDTERCTREESEYYRNLLRRLGPREFCRVTVESDTITAKKLLTAFHVRPPGYLEGQPDEDYYEMLSYALRRELMKRAKIPLYNTVDDAVELIRHAKKIIVLTGAGISTSLGIPDFRSAGGLYQRLQEKGLTEGLDDPQDVFNIEVFRRDPSIFFHVANAILPEEVRFSPTHQFIRLLQNKNKLLTNYTQNIDDIESAAGISPDKIIQCHGSFATATCQVCKHKVKGTEIFAEIKADVIPRCRKCIIPVRPTHTLKRKRSSTSGNKRKRHSIDDDESEDDNIPEAGIMKPDITFFGEQLPNIFSDRLSKHDKDKVDLVITIGTSLKVAPVSEVVPYLPSNIPQIQINRDPVGHQQFDIDLLGECDVVISELCRILEWDLDHEMVPKNQEVAITTEPGHPSRHRFKQTHPAPAPAI